jgi:Type VI secretion system, TssN
MWKPNIESQINSQLNSTINSTLNGSMNSARQGLTGGKNFKSYFLYALVVMLVFALVGWSATLVDIPHMAKYFSVQVIFLLLGMIHASYMNDLLPQIPKENFVKGIIFTLIMMVLGILAIFLLTL